MRRSSTTTCERSRGAHIGLLQPLSAAATPMRPAGACVAMCTATPRPHWPWTSVKRSPSTTERGGVGRRLPTLSSSQHGRKRKGRFGFRDNLVNTNTGRGLDQVQTVVGDVDDGEIGEDTVHAALTGQRQRAVLDDLRGAVLGGVLHHYENFLHAVH